MSDPTQQNPIRLINGNIEGTRGNAFAVLGGCLQVARSFGQSEEWIDTFLNEARSGNYDQAIAIVDKFFTTK